MEPNCQAASSRRACSPIQLQFKDCPYQSNRREQADFLEIRFLPLISMGLRDARSYAAALNECTATVRSSTPGRRRYHIPIETVEPLYLFVELKLKVDRQ